MLITPNKVTLLLWTAKPIKKGKDKTKATSDIAKDDETDCQVVATHESLAVQEQKCTG